jgi:aspartate/methionine/tyrosine aminotransferase
VIGLSVGEPDFETPSFVREAAKKAIDEGFTHYSPAAGYDELREAVAEKLRRENGIACDYESEVVITPGSSSGIFLALLALLDPRDEVLLPDPAWFHYSTLITLCGASAVGLPIKFEQTASLDIEEAERLITDKTKVLILNSPSNPTGIVFSKESIKLVSELAGEHDLIVISDEIYEKIIYPGNVHVSPGSLAELKQRTITSNGFSKAYAMTGWRVGYLAGPSEIIEKVTALNGYTLVCPSSMSQKAALAALKDPRTVSCIKEMVDRLSGRRKVVLEALAGLPGVKVHPPQGAFYAWVDIRGTGMSSEEFAYRLIEDERVGVLPGTIFGENGRGHVRISFATGESQLGEGLERFRRFVIHNASRHA